jgi:hypothetical protein
MARQLISQCVVCCTSQAIDNNELTEFPSGLLLLSELKTLWIR